MTIIEFYDEASIENIAGALLCAPDKVILIGDKRKQLERSADTYAEILAGRGVSTEFSYRSINKNNINDIVSVISEIVETGEDCVFDISGGEDTYLVALGIVWERYPDKVRCQRFNLRNGALNSYDSDGNLCDTRDLFISIEENIRIYGGRVVTDSGQDVYTYDWDFNDDFISDVNTMWSICKKNSRLWNAMIGSMGAVGELLSQGDSLSVSYDKDIIVRELERDGDKYVLIAGIMYELEKRGIISGLVIGDTVSYTFKNEQVKRCLTVAGQVLELAVAIRLRALTQADGSPLYDDVRVGVVIDWDDTLEDVKTINEIDVIAMKRGVPIFISCKNGLFENEELYKLNSVAERFGGEYAKKALVATELDKLGDRAKYIRARMEDMRIRRVENIDEASEEEISRIFRSLATN